MAAPDPSDEALVCPVCESARSEDITVAGGTEGLTYRCQDCDAEFDETGGRVVP